MRILQVLNHFLPEQVAGTEVYTWALSKRLQQVGFEIEIAIPNYHIDVDEEYEYDGLHITKFAEPSKLDRALIMGKRKPEGVRYFEALLKRLRPSVVHFHELAGSNGITVHHVEAAKRMGCKVVMTFHLSGYSCRTGNMMYLQKEVCSGIIDVKRCSKCYLESRGYKNIFLLLLPFSMLLYKKRIDSSRFKSKIGTALSVPFLIEDVNDKLGRLAKSCDIIVPITKWYRKVLEENGVTTSKIRVVEQGLPSGVLANNRREKNQAINVVKLVFVGRISRFKGLHLLIAALFKLPSENFQLDIYGLPDQTEYAEHLRRKTKDITNIHWKGAVKQSEVVDTLREYDLLCLCSTFSEMSPLVIQEAFAAGLPVLASNVPGNAEQIQHGVNGLLFQFNDRKSLQDQLRRVHKNPEIIAQLKERVGQHRNFTDVASDYMKIYTELSS